MLDPGNSALLASSPIHPYFFLIFSDFYCHFSSRKALFSIFGSVHWTLKQYPSIMTTILTLFFQYFHYFLDIFHSAQPHLTCLEMCAGPWTQCPTWSPTILHFFSDFFAILLVFFIQHSHTFHIGKYTLHPENSAQHCHQQWAPLGVVWLQTLVSNQYKFNMRAVSNNLYSLIKGLWLYRNSLITSSYSYK